MTVKELNRIRAARRVLKQAFNALTDEDVPSADIFLVAEYVLVKVNKAIAQLNRIAGTL